MILLVLTRRINSYSRDLYCKVECLYFFTCTRNCVCMCVFSNSRYDILGINLPKAIAYKLSGRGQHRDNPWQIFTREELQNNYANWSKKYILNWSWQIRIMLEKITSHKHVQFPSVIVAFMSPNLRYNVLDTCIYYAWDNDLVSGDSREINIEA